MQPKLWLTSMSNGGNEDNIRDMIAPISEWLDGIIWVLHDTSPEDLGAQYLETAKGDGRVIHRQFNYRHFHSMNETLFSGLIAEGDLVIWTDCLERPMPQFVSRVKGDINQFMLDHGVDCLFYYGKPFLFRYNELMHYSGSPHWWMSGFTSPMEWSSIYPDEKQVRWNVRPIKRPDKFGWIAHYARYHVSFPAGSNSALLGLEKQGDPSILFPIAEKRRLDFRRELIKRGVPLTHEGLLSLYANPLDSTLKSYYNSTKELNDHYRYYALGDTTVVDTHRLEDMKEIT